MLLFTLHGMWVLTNIHGSRRSPDSLPKIAHKASPKEHLVPHLLIVVLPGVLGIVHMRLLSKLPKWGCLSGLQISGNCEFWRAYWDPGGLEQPTLKKKRGRAFLWSPLFCCSLSICWKCSSSSSAVSLGVGEGADRTKSPNASSSACIALCISVLLFIVPGTL